MEIKEIKIFKTHTYTKNQIIKHCYITIMLTKVIYTNLMEFYTLYIDTDIKKYKIMDKYFSNIQLLQHS